jgi:hypothetical protein
VSLYVALRDPFIQTFVARSATTYLARELGTNIKIDRLFFDLDFNLTLKGLKVIDLHDRPLLDAGEIRFSLKNLKFKDKLQINSLKISDMDVQIIKYKGEDDLNFQFIADFFSSENVVEDTISKVFPIKINNLLISNGAFRYLDEEYADSEEIGIDYSHIRAENIFLKASDLSVLNDSVSLELESLKAKEQSGFELKNLEALLTMGNHGLRAESLLIETQNSFVNMNLNLNYNDYSAFYDFIDSVFIDVEMAPTSFQLADLGYFAPVMFEMENLVNLSGKVKGFVRDFTANEFSFSYGQETEFLGRFTMTGLPDFYASDINLRISRLSTNYTDILSFRIPVEGGQIPLPDNLSELGRIDISGSFKGYYDDFMSRSVIKTSLGQLQSDFVLRMNPRTKIPSYKGQLTTKQLNLGKLIGNEKALGFLNMNVKIDGQGFDLETAHANITGKINTLEIFENNFEDIQLSGDLTSQAFNGAFSIDEDNLKLDFNGLADFHNGQPEFDFNVNLSHADLYALNLLETDSLMEFSTLFNARFKGLSLDSFLGSITLNNTKYKDSRGIYRMNKMEVRMEENPYLERKLNVFSDFLDLELGGAISFSDIDESFKRVVSHFIAFDNLKPTDKTIKEQDFYFNLKLKEPEALSRLFIPSLRIADNSNFSGVYTSRQKLMNASLSCDWIDLSGVKFNKPYLLVQSDTSLASISFEMSNIIFREGIGSDSNDFGIESPVLKFALKNDSIAYNFRWDNQNSSPRNIGDIKGYYSLGDEHPSKLHISQAAIVINDSTLRLKKENRILFFKEYTQLDNFEFSLGNSSLSLEGRIPLTEMDSLQLRFTDWDLSTFDILTRTKGFDLDGIIQGDLILANLTANPAFFSNLHISDFNLNGERLGEARLLSSWSNTEESIYVNAQIINIGNVSTSRMLNLRGFYYPTKEIDNIRFDLSLENFRLKILNQFFEGTLSRLEGLASGEFTIDGELLNPVVKGNIGLQRTSFLIDYLNVVYSIQHNFEIKPGLINIENLVMYDTLGNKAQVNGSITHNHLRNFAFDIRLRPENLLSLNTGPKQNDLFYGSAVVSGEVLIRGPLDNIDMSIRAISQKGTNMVIPLNNTGSVGGSDYITFLSPDDLEEEEEFLRFKSYKAATGFGINLETVVTPDATLKIFLPYNIGNLDARGSGNLSMGVNASGDFTLNGDYVVQTGQFVFAFENLLKKRFDLMDGGRISWTGDPYDAEIDVKGVYRVKASLAGLGLDSTSSLRNRVNVDCIIHLSKQLFNPDIRFSFKLPGIDTQLEQIVFNVLDTTNDALMTQQMISLLVLGSFSYAAADNFSLGSSSFDMLSGQLSGWLSQISKDFDIGVHYRPGDKLSNEELEVALSTQLFNDRVSIDGNFGVINNRNTTQNASNIVGDFDISVKITPDGKLQLKVFNHSNINNVVRSTDFDKYSPYTQGVGISFSQEFDKFGDLVRRRKKQKQNEAM